MKLSKRCFPQCIPENTKPWNVTKHQPISPFLRRWISEKYGFKYGLRSCLFFDNPRFPNLFSFTAPFSEAKLSGTVFFWNARWGIQVKGSESHSVMSDSLRPHGLCSPLNFPDQNTEMGSLSLLQGISPTQGSNPGLPHCRWILYKLSHERSPRIRE